MYGRISGHIRANIWAIVACFVAVMGTAVVASASDDGRQAKSSATARQQVAKLKRKVSGLTQRVAALEGRPDQVGQVPSALPPNGPAGGDLTGNYPNPLIGPDAIGSGEVAPNSLVGDDIDESTLAGVPISGVAGGDLTGAYPNPLIDSNAVGTNEVDATLSASDIANTSSLGGLEINEGALNVGGQLTGTVANAQIAPPGIGARAFGQVPETGGLVVSKNITSVTRAAEGIYCINPAPSVTDPIVVLTTSNLQGNGTDPVAQNHSVVEWRANNAGCPAGTFAVYTMVFMHDQTDNDTGGDTAAFDDEPFIFMIP
jgi:hypothetical protein